MTAYQAALTTYKEFEYKLKAWEKQYYKDWEVARWQVFQRIWLSPDIKKQDKPKRVEDVLRLPTDRKAKKSISLTPSEEELAELRGLGIIR